MTVCIAAVCQQSGEPRIVICADTRLESPGVGAADSMLKMLPLGYGWIALLATEDWNSASTLRDHLRGQWRRIRKLASPRRVSELTKTLSDQFAQTPFCTAQTEALICGFAHNKPVILYLYVDPTTAAESITASAMPSFEAIGSGGPIARIFLNQRDCGPADDIERTLYVVYEAKRASEKASGVGPGITLAAIGPVVPGQLHVNFFLPVRDEGKKVLERYRKRLGLKPIPHLVDLYNYLTPSAPQDPQSTTPDWLFQPPSPESPEESGES
jgi:hypothetical protein